MSMLSLAQRVCMFKDIELRETGISISMIGATLPGDQLLDASGQFPQPVLGWTFLSPASQYFPTSRSLQHSSLFWSILCFFVYFTTCSLALFRVLVGLGVSLDQREYFFLLKGEKGYLFSEISQLINAVVQNCKPCFPFLLYRIYKHIYPLIWLFYF